MSLRSFWNAARVAVIFTAILAAVPVRAATVTSANDYPSTLQAGVDADHYVVFTTPSGVDEGETIVLTFGSAFDMVVLTEDDVDVEDDGVDLTTAANCAGAEQASVVAAADVVTITICAGDGGAIAAASEVGIRIGLNATSSGTGVNQIENPALSRVGTHYISISGTFGDSGSIALPIMSDGSVTVDATVDQGGAPGGGDGGPEPGCGDTTAPIISGVVISGVTASSATVSWTTNENADSKVDYGLTTSYEIGTQTDTSLVSSHGVTLSGLSSGTTYHVRVRSADLCANEASASDYQFTTTDTTAPIISGLDVALTCDTSASITWTTNEPASSEVDYGLTSSYGTNVSDATLVTSHNVVLSGLTRDVTYHYEVRSADASLNESASGDQVFITNEDAAPSNVSGFGVTAGDASNLLSWTNPGSDFSGVRVLACTNTFPSDVSDSDCSTIYDGSGSSYNHSGLINGTTYYYGVFAYDACGQFSSGALGSGTPSAPEEEVPPPEDEEDEETPPSDPPQDSGSFCGDGACDVTESADSCPADCQSEEIPPEEEEEEQPPEVDSPPVDVPPTTVGEPELIPETDVQIFVAEGSIQLEPISTGEYRLLSSRWVRVVLLGEHLTKSVDRVQMTLGAEAYAMALSGTDYLADLISPARVASQTLAVSVFYTDGTTQTLSYLVHVVEDGYTFDNSDEGRQRVGNSDVSLFQGSVIWDGSPYNQFNPIISGADGSFAWYVPNGTYVVRAEKSGYEGASSGTLLVSDHIVNPVIGMSLIPELIPEPVESPTSVIPSAVATVENVLEVIDDVRSLPEVQTAVDVALPVAAVTAVATTASLALAFDLIPFLQYLVTSPFLFFWRRKRKGFGIVYNGITKVPVDLAIVRLFQLPEEALGMSPLPQGRLVSSRVTDKGGRYFFLAQPGLYRITVTKTGFSFPSDYLKDVKDDGTFLDVYHGEAVTVNARDAVIAANIPMDPSQGAEGHTPSQLRWNARLRLIQQVVAVSGVVVALVVVALRPSIFTAVMAVVQVLVYIVARRLAAPKKPKSWGIVYDKRTGRPVSQVVVRVFEPHYNKLLETTVTDSKGRYTALLGPNEYYTVFERDGYETREIRPIDLTKNTEPTELAMNVDLLPKGMATDAPPPPADPTPPTPGESL